MLEILGYPDRDTLLQVKSLEIYIDPDDRKQLQHLLEDKGFVHDYTVQLRRHDGSTVWVTINTRVVHDSDSQMTHYDGSMEDISYRKAVEEHIYKLSHQLMQAQEEERQMISRELHDSVAQDLSALKISCDMFFDNQPSVARDTLRKVKEFSTLLDKAILTVRDLAYDLRPPSLDDIGLIQTLSTYCETFSEKSGLSVDFNPVGLDYFKLDHDTEINLYRLVQEGLNNISKHADAQHVVVRLLGAFPDIFLRIEDDGKGFDVEKRKRTADSEKRMGLRSMAERVNLLQGQMKIHSRPMQGTKIIIKFPYKEK
jgi:PAS domain S-box-containing protein